MNQEGIGAMTNLILSSVSEPHRKADGTIENYVDNELLFYRFLNVNSDNFAAFVLECKNCITWAETIENHVTPFVAVSLKSQMKDIVRNYLVSVTGKSGEDGKLMKMLLQDKSESVIQFKGENKGMFDKLKNSQGNNDQQQQQGVQQ